MKQIFGRAALRAATALAFGALAGTAHAQTVSALQGEGSGIATQIYNGEFQVIPNDSHYSFLEYGTSSGQAQAAVTANLGTAGVGVPSGKAVDWGASDTAVNATFQSGWNAAPTGQPEAGPFIQIPLLGLGIAIPFNDPGIKTNAALKLDDNDLCGIFSAKLADWEQLSHPVKGVTGAIQIYYRLDLSYTTLLLTEHLSGLNSAGNPVCNAGNTAHGFTFMPTDNFASLFPGGPPGRFHGVVGGAGEANGIQNDKSGAGGTASALGYLTPDYTNVVATPQPGFGTLKAASVINHANNLAYQPTYQYIEVGLSSPGFGAINPRPPSVANAGNQFLWVPGLAVVNAGYSIVGYTNWLLPQCFNESDGADRGPGLVEFLTDHYDGGANILVNNSGFVVLGQSVTINGKPFKNLVGQAYVKAIKADFLSNPGAGNLGIDSSNGCKKYPGRPNHSGS